MRRLTFLWLLFIASGARAERTETEMQVRVVDRSGQPVAGACVEARPFRDESEERLSFERGERPSWPGKSQSDAAGQAHLKISEGTFLLHVSAPGFASREVTGEIGDSPAPTIDITLLPGSAISGRATDEAGKPIERARVEAAALNLSSPLAGKELAKSWSEKDGSFSLADAPEKPLRVTVSAPGRSVFEIVVSRSAAPASISAILKAGSRVEGVVTDERGEPASDVIVSAGVHANKSGPDGRFALDGVSPGHQTFEAWKGDLTALATAVVPERGASSVRLRLVKAASVEGAVLDSITRRPISAVAASTSENRRGASDSKGNFALTRLLPGRIGITLHRDGYVGQTLFASLVQGEKKNLRIALEPAAILSGRVVGDGNRPVEGSRVTLERTPGPRRMRMRATPAEGGEDHPFARTDAQGRFQLSVSAHEGRVNLVASADGYTAAHLPAVTVRPAKTVSGLLLHLSRGFEASGRVVNASHAPVAGADVRVHAPSNVGRFAGAFQAQATAAALPARDEEAEQRPATTTRPDGTFRLSNLPGGPLELDVERVGFAKKIVAGITIGAAGSAKIADIVLEPAAAIRGKVVDTNQNPVVGASLFGSGRRGEQDEEMQSATDGTFEMTSFSAGAEVMLSVRAQGHPPERRTIHAPAENVVVVLKNTGMLAGTVVDAESRQPLNDFRIGRTRPGPRMVVVTDTGSGTFHSDDGSFELPDIPAGRWSFTATADGYQDQNLSGIEISEGGTHPGLVFEMKRGSTLRGHVVDDSTSSPISAAVVSWSSSGGAATPAFGMSGQSPNIVSTDADGHFEFSGVAPETILLTAREPNHADASLSTDARTIKDDVEIRMTAGLSITGMVVGGDGSTPVPGAQVALQTLGSAGFGGNDSASSDSSGAFEFDHLQNGRFSLVARSQTAASQPAIVTLAGQPAAGVILNLANGTRVYGNVTGLAAAELPNLTVSGTGSENFRGSATIGSDATYSLANVPSGAAQIVASTGMTQGRTVRQNIEVPDGQTEMEVDISFPPASTLSGTVTRGGRAVVSAQVIVSPENPGNPPTSGRSQTDENGSYSVSGLQDGDYAVTVVETSGGPRQANQKTVTVSGDTQFDIPLPTITLTGSIVEADSNQPVAGVRVSLDSGAATNPIGIKRATTDSTGAFSIDGLDPSSYALTAEKTGWQTIQQTAQITDTPDPLTLSMTRAEGITIIGVDGLSGIPLSGLRALVFDGSGNVAFDGIVPLDSTGHGEIPQLSPGVYSAYFFTAGYAPRAVPGLVIPSPPLTVTMTPGGRLMIHVGSQSAGASASLVLPEGIPYLLNGFRFDGRFTLNAPLSEFDNVAPGSYLLIMTAPGQAAQSLPVTIGEAQTTNLTVP